MYEFLATSAATSGSSTTITTINLFGEAIS